MTNEICLKPWNDSEKKPLVQFKNVVKRYGDYTAIHDLNLDIYQGEFFALLGPSGCGKTTIMRMLAGFESVTAGDILLADRSLNHIAPNHRPVNMMFQSYALFPHLNVEQNIAFGLKRDKLSTAQIKQRVDEMVSLVRLEKFVKRGPHQLSGGQRQRVALARALAKQPQLLLLDEPLGALDKKLREKTQFELVNIQEKLGITFIIVTHDQEEAMTVASRIAVMDEGYLIQVAEPATIYERPRSTYVADFIGDINFIQGHLQKTGDSTGSLTWGDNQAPIQVHDIDGHLPKDGAVTFAIRPEKIYLSDAPIMGEEDLNSYTAKIIDIAYVGNITTYHLKLANGQDFKVQLANQRRHSNRQFTWDDEVHIAWRHTAGLVLED